MYKINSIVSLPVGYKFQNVEVTSCYYSAASDRYVISYKVIK